jgi:hypothetical protein
MKHFCVAHRVWLGGIATITGRKDRDAFGAIVPATHTTLTRRLADCLNGADLAVARKFVELGPDASARAVARELTARGVKTPQGGVNWQPVQVARIMKNAAG